MNNNNNRSLYLYSNSNNFSSKLIVNATSTILDFTIDSE